MLRESQFAASPGPGAGVSIPAAGNSLGGIRAGCDVALDDDGFVLAGQRAGAEGILESSVPGVFAVGSPP
jgi:thioredoxin reductase